MILIIIHLKWIFVDYILPFRFIHHHILRAGLRGYSEIWCASPPGQQYFWYPTPAWRSTLYKRSLNNTQYTIHTLYKRHLVHDSFWRRPGSNVRTILGISFTASWPNIKFSFIQFGVRGTRLKCLIYPCYPTKEYYLQNKRKRKWNKISAIKLQSI